MAASDDAAVKQRVITHMNNDHQDSIIRYVEHAEDAPFLQSYNAKLTDITTAGMRISYGSGNHTYISFDPPMKSLREARERLVQLDKEATAALGRDPIPITTFIPCYTRLAHLMNFTICLLTYALISRRSNIEPGSWLYDGILHHFPGFVWFVGLVGVPVFWLMIFIHSAETWAMAKKLRRHGLTPLDKLWWQWCGTCFVEGLTSFRRLDGFIEERRREKEAKKH